MRGGSLLFVGGWRNLVLWFGDDANRVEQMVTNRARHRQPRKLHRRVEPHACGAACKT